MLIYIFIEIESFPKVMDARGLCPENSTKQIGIDDGQGMIKVMETVKEKDVVREPKKEGEV